MSSYTRFERTQRIIEKIIDDRKDPDHESHRPEDDLIPATITDEGERVWTF